MLQRSRSQQWHFGDPIGTSGSEMCCRLKAHPAAKTLALSLQAGPRPLLVEGHWLLRLPRSRQGLQRFSSPAERREGCRGAFVT